MTRVWSTVRSGPVSSASSGKTMSPTERAMPSEMAPGSTTRVRSRPRSEEHTSELQSRENLVCRLLLDPVAPSLYPLPLHDALPISGPLLRRLEPRDRHARRHDARVVHGALGPGELSLEREDDVAHGARDAERDGPRLHDAREVAA